MNCEGDISPLCRKINFKKQGAIREKEIKQNGASKGVRKYVSGVLFGQEMSCNTCDKYEKGYFGRSAPINDIKRGLFKYRFNENSHRMAWTLPWFPW